jgi:hypothetical protein
MRGEVVIREALISDDGVYRYSLSRKWDDKSPSCIFIGLNPSTADGMEDDPTIRRCIDFARTWDCGSVHVVNLFALRSTDPFKLFKSNASLDYVEPCGPGNDDTIRGILATVPYRFVVVAWGTTNAAHPVFKARVKEVRELHLADKLDRVKCLGVTANGNPRHPLYVRRSAPLVPWGAM